MEWIDKIFSDFVKILHEFLNIPWVFHLVEPIHSDFAATIRPKDVWSCILIPYKVHIFWEGHKICEISTLLLYVCTVDKRFRKILWPSHNIRTLISLDLSKLSIKSTMTTLWKNMNVKIQILKSTLKIFWPHYICKFQLLLVGLLLSGKKVVIRHTSKPGRCFAKMGKLLHLQILLQKKSANSTLEYYSAKWPIKLVFVAKRFVES